MTICPPADEHGRTTAEYAVGVTGAACIACVFWTVFGDGDAHPIMEILDRLRDLGRWVGERAAT